MKKKKEEEYKINGQYEFKIKDKLEKIIKKTRKTIFLKNMDKY